MPFLNFTDQVPQLLIVLATLFVLPWVQWLYRGTLFTYNLVDAHICIFDHVMTHGWHGSLKSYLPELFVFNIFKPGKMAHVSGWYSEMHFMFSEFWLNFNYASSSRRYVSIYWGKDLVPNGRKVIIWTSVAFLVTETVYIVHRRICHFIYIKAARSMMTSRYWNTFRATVPLRRETSGHWWILLSSHHPMDFSTSRYSPQYGPRLTHN